MNVHGPPCAFLLLLLLLLAIVDWRPGTTGASAASSLASKKSAARRPVAKTTRNIEYSNNNADDDDDDDDDDADLQGDETGDSEQIKGPKSRFTNSVPARVAISKKTKKKKKQTMFGFGIESAGDLASKAMKLTKGSVKAAVDLCANKHVNLLQIVGKWRIQQEIEVRKGVFVACPATIEFLEDGSVVTTCEGQEYKSEFTFKERSWPRKCTISFQARAYQGPKDPEPVAMYYKGYFKRSIMNPNVVLIRGKVYRLSGKLFFKRQEKCGRFKATKRRYN